MEALSLPSPRDGGGTGKPLRRGSTLAHRLLIACGVAAIGVLAARAIPSSPARADDPPARSDVKPAPQERRNGDFIARHERRLAGLDRRLTALANLVLADAELTDKARNQSVDLMIKARSAEAEYRNAKLEREVAEILVKEYTLGTAVTDKAVVDGEISLAKSEVERSRQEVLDARQRLARISALADNSASGLNMIYLYTDKVALAEVRVKQAAFTLEQAESKKKILTEFTIPKRTLELRSEEKKAHSRELASQATWELTKAMAEQARKESSASDLPDDRKRILGLIDQAIPLEEKIQARLQEAGKAGTIAQTLVDEISRLTGELETVIEQAESAQDFGTFARLKSRIQKTAKRYKVAAAR